MKRIVLLIGIFLGLCSFNLVARAEQGNISLTVYNQNFGLIRDVRYLDLKERLNTVRFAGIPELIERESVHFRSLTYLGSSWVREQTLEVIISGAERTSVLVWEIVNEKAGRHKVEVTYLTGGLNWSANYIVIVSQDSLNLNSWVTLNNTSGIAYRDATLKLVAGDVRRVRERPRVMRKEMVPVPAIEALQEPEFEERQLFEYHIYTLPRKITLQNNQEKQVLFLTSQDIPFRRVYTFETGARHWWWDRRVEPLRAPVKVTLEFKNDEEFGLGKPLPAGRVQVYKETEAGLEFIGEDSILHTPKSEEVKLYIGNAFDIIGEKKHAEHKEVAPSIFENTYEISLRNHKKEKVTIQVIERLTGDWEIIQANYDYKKKDAFTIEFTVDISPESSRSITYTVRHKE